MDDRTNFCVGWGTLALINAGLAQGKGRSGLIRCLSLVLGPIATFSSSWTRSGRIASKGSKQIRRRHFSST